MILHDCLTCGAQTMRGDLCSRCASKRKDTACEGGCGKQLLAAFLRCGTCRKTSATERHTPQESGGGVHSPAPARFRKPRSERQWKELRAYAALKGVEPETLFNDE